MSEKFDVNGPGLASALAAQGCPGNNKQDNANLPRGSVRGLLSRVGGFFHLFWLLTESNAPTFVVPNTMFGLCGAAAGSWIIPVAGEYTPAVDIAKRFGLVVLYNWTNLFIFDLANQRLPVSAEEDALNKPWRPVPRGLITSDQIRRTMLYLIPAVVALNHFYLQTGVQSMAIMVLTWLYNDLQGGDEGYIFRNAVIAAAFAIFNEGSVKVAVGPENAGGSGLLFSRLTTTGVTWTAIVSLAIFTTMQVQDLQDQEGDRARGRKSAPIELGDRAARWTVVIPMFIWPVFCAWYWQASLLLSAPQGLVGLVVAVRCLTCSGLMADKLTWRLWCLWTALLYMLPPLCYWLQ